MGSSFTDKAVKKMKKTNFLACITAALILAGCATDPVQKFYTRTTLNQLSLGNTKAQLLNFYRSQPTNGNIPGMEIRASQKSGNGKLIEVGEVTLTDGVTSNVPHWFIFENGVLVQWGRPEDWQQAATRYEINYNRAPGVPKM